MAKAKTSKSKTLPEAETRLRAALERLETIVKTKKASHAEAEKLRQDNAELEGDFQGLKSEYSSLEKSFQDLKETVANMSAKKKADKGSPELGGGDWKDGQIADPENEFLKKELERVHKEYKTIDQSFRVLRSQYNELQKSYEDALDGGSEQEDLLLAAAHTPEPEAKPDNGVKELKADLGSQLDKTISALEKLVG
ncbi:MAG: hypothetical protein V3R64_01090 [Sphingomonadales bacterium]